VSWGTWTQAGAPDPSAPYTETFSFPNGYGYYEFYSIATDNLGGTEAAPAYAQAAVHYEAASGQAQTVSFAQPADAPVNASFPVSATADSGLPVSFSSQTLSICTVSGNTVTTLTIGTCTLTADQAGNAGYWLPASTSRSFAVQGLGQTISFAGLTDHALDGGGFNLGATASSGLPVQFISLTTSICTVSGNAVTLVAVGSCQIAANQPGDAVYAAAATVTQSFNVTAAAGGGGSETGDVPLPAWAYALLAIGLLEAMRRRRAGRY
jgi:hypothetical protein